MVVENQKGGAYDPLPRFFPVPKNDAVDGLFGSEIHLPPRGRVVVRGMTDGALGKSAVRIAVNRFGGLRRGVGASGVASVSGFEGEAFDACRADGERFESAAVAAVA